MGDLCHVKFRFCLCKAFLSREVPEKLTALDEVHDEVNSQGFLENVIHSDDEGMIDLLKDHAFHFKTSDRPMRQHHILPYTLHSK